MGWDKSRPGTDPKYRSKRHRDEVARLKAKLKRQGYLICTAVECVFDSRVITSADGMARDGLNAGHDDAGTNYVGPQHRACNIRDGAVRARAKQDPKSQANRWFF